MLSAMLDALRLDVSLVGSSQLKPCRAAKSGSAPELYRCAASRCKSTVWTNSPQIGIWYDAGCFVGKLCPGCAARLGSRAIQKIAARTRSRLIHRRLPFER